MSNNNSNEIIKKKWIRKDILTNFLDKMSPKPNQLPSLDKVLKITKFKNRKFLGTKEIELKNIIGSEGRYSDFDRNYLPNNESLKFRLDKIRKLYEEGYHFPPIKVYKIDEYYFVSDGNHRVAIAKSRGQIYIDAEVTEYYLDVPITRKLTIKDQLLIQEHSNFLQTTGLSKYGRESVINLSKPKSYGILVGIIEDFIKKEKNKNGELTFIKGAALWYHSVFLPFAEDAYRYDMLNRFPGRTTGDLYVWLQLNWKKLKKNNNNSKISSNISNILVDNEIVDSESSISKKEIKILQEIYNKNTNIEDNYLLKHNIAIAVLNVIIYISDFNNPKLITVKRKYHPSEGQCSLPLSMLRFDEELGDATNRCQKNVLGLNNPIKLIHNGINDKRSRHPFGRIIAISYLGILCDINKKLAFTAGHLADSLNIVELKCIPTMVYDHNRITIKALKYISDNYNNLNIFSNYFGQDISYHNANKVLHNIKDIYTQKYSKIN